MLTITKEFVFDAAHKLCCKDLSEEENRELYGKCSRLHGHSYRLQLTVSGPVGSDGMIINFAKLKKTVNEKITDRYDHACLNDLDEYLGIPVTAENMVVHIYKVIDKLFKLSEITLQSVVVYETPTSWATMTRS